jgi:hypothetical protein
MIILGVGRSRRRLFRAGLFDAAVDLGSWLITSGLFVLIRFEF